MQTAEVQIAGPMAINAERGDLEQVEGGGGGYGGGGGGFGAGGVGGDGAGAGAGGLNQSAGPRLAPGSTLGLFGAGGGVGTVHGGLGTDRAQTTCVRQKEIFLGVIFVVVVIIVVVVAIQDSLPNSADSPDDVGVKADSP